LPLPSGIPRVSPPHLLMSNLLNESLSCFNFSQINRSSVTLTIYLYKVMIVNSVNNLMLILFYLKVELYKLMICICHMKAFYFFVV
jgi:hypothetical protein